MRSSACRKDVVAVRFWSLSAMRDRGDVEESRRHLVGGRFFAHPHSHWERGSNENLNRIVREFFPKGVPITADPAYLAMVAAEINDRPRKIFDWKKPSEIFAELVEADASTD